MKRSKDKFYMKQIFDCISDGEIIATGKIAKEIGLSEKSVRNRLNELSDFLLENNLGDHKKIDNEISELRFKFGSGYRIYFTEIDNIIVLLINGGDKSTQSKDIIKAKSILQEWRNLQ